MITFKWGMIGAFDFTSVAWDTISFNSGTTLGRAPSPLLSSSREFWKRLKPADISKKVCTIIAEGT